MAFAAPYYTIEKLHQPGFSGWYSRAFLTVFFQMTTLFFLEFQHSRRYAEWKMPHVSPVGAVILICANLYAVVSCMLSVTAADSIAANKLDRYARPGY